jgi:hypothetical protein
VGGIRVHAPEVDSSPPIKDLANVFEFFGVFIADHYLTNEASKGVVSTRNGLRPFAPLPPATGLALGGRLQAIKTDLGIYASAQVERK